MTGVLIITEVASAGGVFLIYFLFALWRDGRRPPKSKRVEIRVIPGTKKKSGKLLQLHAPQELKKQKEL